MMISQNQSLVLCHGCKKAIFRLSSGARVVSSKTEDSAVIVFVEQGWEFTPDWNTKRAVATV